MRIIFMGTPDFSVPALVALKEAGHEILAVVTQPDKPKGRGKEVQMTPVKEKALEYQIPVYQPVKARDPEFVKILSDMDPELIVVIAFGQLLPKSILDIPKYGCVNIHASLLPKYRGASPIQYAVINGEKESGVTTMMMAESLDTGDMLDQETVALDEKETFGSLHDKALAMTISAAKIIEYCLAAGPKPVKPLELRPRIKKMIDDYSCPVVILDHDGTIYTANHVFASSLTGSDTTGKSLGNYLADKNALDRLIANNYEQPSEEIEFKTDFTPHKRETLRCRLLRKRQIRLLSGEVHTLLIFKNQGSADQKINHSSPSCSSVSTSHKLSKPHGIDYIGESTAWSKVDSIVQKTAKFPSNVLLLGETGTGKEVVAKTIHQRSGRKGNFVAINCGALPKDLLHSELFGYEEGAFTGARAHGSIGKFEHAHEGTLLLDEIGEMPLDMQVTLLRFLQERTITRINSNKPKKVDVRIIAATNKDMTELVRLGQFRQDLYYRLNVIEINLPPLHERKCDIPLLAEYFISELSRQYNVPSKQIHPAALQILCGYSWPGNVRELKNVIEKALILSEGIEITPEFLPESILPSQNGTSQSPPFAPRIGESEREHIINLLESYHGNIFQTAKALKISRNTLYRKIEKYNIQLKTSAVKK